MQVYLSLTLKRLAQVFLLRKIIAENVCKSAQKIENRFGSILKSATNNYFHYCLI